MFKKKKKENSIKTYIDGVEQESDDIQIPIPPPHLQAGAPALEPQAVQEPTLQPEGMQVQQFNGDCIICFDFGFYADIHGVWHNCPRCNSKTMKTLTKSSMVIPKPTKGNLFEFRTCPDCGEVTEIHKKRKKWECEHCQWRGE